MTRVKYHAYSRRNECATPTPDRAALHEGATNEIAELTLARYLQQGRCRAEIGFEPRYP